MPVTSYEEFVQRLFAKRNKGVDGYMHAAVGISGEAGELLDAVKKVWVYEKPIDIVNIVEELGDLEFYMQALRSLLGVTREEVIQANVEKLNRRYPGGYTDAAAIARADKAATPSHLPHWKMTPEEAERFERAGGKLAPEGP